MNRFASSLATSVERYVALQRSLGYQFRKPAASLRAFVRYVRSIDARGPLSQALALDFVTASNLTPDGRAVRYAMIRRFAAQHAAFDARTENFDPRALPRSRAIPPPRILIAVSLRISRDCPFRGRTLATVIGLLASTGLRSGEALRLDCDDVDLGSSVLQIRKTKFRKDRLVPIHPTTLEVLREYIRHRNLIFPICKTPAFFLSSRGGRLSHSTLNRNFRQACELAEIKGQTAKEPRPHDLRHRFAVTRLAEWHRQKIDVQPMLPLLATYLGHVRYSDTAYYITATPELLGLASARAFGKEGSA